MKSKNFGVMALTLIGVILIGVVSYVIISSNQTVEAYVPSHDLANGHVITEEDIEVIQVPVGTPEGYIRNKDQLINHKVRTDVAKGQLLYESNFLGSWESYTEEIEVPEDFIITTLNLSKDQSCDNLIVTGDYIDILGTSEILQPAFEEEVDYNTRNHPEIESYTYYILSNVKVLGTNNTTVSEEGEEEEDSSNSDVNTFIIALSYEDYKKLRQAERILDLWANITPKQNNVEGENGEINPPLINQMIGNSFSKLHDANEEVMDKEGNIIDSDIVIDEIKSRDTDSDNAPVAQNRNDTDQ